MIRNRLRICVDGIILLVLYVLMLVLIFRLVILIVFSDDMLFFLFVFGVVFRVVGWFWVVKVLNG